MCANTDGQFPPEVRSAAVLTLCKFMCVSSAFCEAQLQLLFSVVKHETTPAVRANVAVALGDLAVRHPNLVEPWTAHLYAQLHDGSLRVRKNVLMVLTHLILNDMVKVRALPPPLSGRRQPQLLQLVLLGPSGFRTCH